MTDLIEPFPERKKKFHEEYRELVMKYKIDFIALLKQSQNAIEAVLGFIDLTQKPQDQSHPPLSN